MKINNKPILEADFSCMGLRLYFAKFYNHKYSDVGDLYNFFKPRDLAKEVLNIILNSHIPYPEEGEPVIEPTLQVFKETVRKAVAHRIQSGDSKVSATNDQIKACINMAFYTYPELADIMYAAFPTNYLLHKIESDIAIEVMYQSAKEKFLVLPNHDAFICEEKYAAKLVEIMEDAFCYILGRETGCLVDAPTNLVKTDLYKEPNINERIKKMRKERKPSVLLKPKN
jgi:hypothetical protein